MSDELTTRVIRKLGSSRVHVARFPVELLHAFRVFGSAGLGVALPVVTVCASELKGRNDVGVCMEPGTRVTCSRCRRLATIEQAEEGNNLYRGLDGEALWGIAQAAKESG